MLSLPVTFVRIRLQERSERIASQYAAEEKFQLLQKVRVGKIRNLTLLGRNQGAPSHQEGSVLDNRNRRKTKPLARTNQGKRTLMKTIKEEKHPRQWRASLSWVEGQKKIGLRGKSRGTNPVCEGGDKKTMRKHKTYYYEERDQHGKRWRRGYYWGTRKPKTF